MNEEQLMKEIIKEQTQKIINLEQYLRIEKEVSDETSWNRITICFDCHKKIHPWLSNPVRLGNGFI